MKAVLKST